LDSGRVRRVPGAGNVIPLYQFRIEAYSLFHSEILCLPRGTDEAYTMLISTMLTRVNSLAFVAARGKNHSKSGSNLREPGRKELTQVNYRSDPLPYTRPIDEPEHRIVDGTRLCEDSPSLKN
jgi:hypothetical protein